MVHSVSSAPACAAAVRTGSHHDHARPALLAVGMSAAAMCPKKRAQQAGIALAVLSIEQMRRTKCPHWAGYNKAIAARVDRMMTVREHDGHDGCECMNGTQCVQRLSTKRPHARLMVTAAGEEVWISPPMQRARLARRDAVVGAALFKESVMREWTWDAPLTRSRVLHWCILACGGIR